MSAVDDLNFANVEELATAIRAAGITWVTTDRNDLRTPGVWIRFEGLPPSPLAACVMRLSVFAIVEPTSNGAQQDKALADLWNTLRPVLENYGGPAGLVSRIGLLPDGATTPLPALLAPLDLVTTEGEI